jgi:hypothetical protein
LVFNSRQVGKLKLPKIVLTSARWGAPWVGEKVQKMLKIFFSRNFGIVHGIPPSLPLEMLV